MIWIDVEVIKKDRRIAGLEDFVLLNSDEAMSRDNNGEEKQNNIS